MDGLIVADTLTRNIDTARHYVPVIAMIRAMIQWSRIYMQLQQRRRPFRMDRN
jgi:hypothetical protein